MASHTAHGQAHKPFYFSQCLATHGFFRDSVLITDKDGRVIAMIAGHPDDPDWDKLQEEAAKRLETLRKDCLLSSDQHVHRRGRFAALSCGISYGSGQTVHAQLSSNVNKV